MKLNISKWDVGDSCFLTCGNIASVIFLPRMYHLWLVKSKGGAEQVQSHALECEIWIPLMFDKGMKDRRIHNCFKLKETVRYGSWVSCVLLEKLLGRRGRRDTVTTVGNMNEFLVWQGYVGIILTSIPGSGRSSGEGNGNPLQYSHLENPMDGRAS